MLSLLENSTQPNLYTIKKIAFLLAAVILAACQTLRKYPNYGIFVLEMSHKPFVIYKNQHARQPPSYQQVTHIRVHPAEHPNIYNSLRDREKVGIVPSRIN